VQLVLLAPKLDVLFFDKILVKVFFSQTAPQN